MMQLNTNELEDEVQLESIGVNILSEDKLALTSATVLFDTAQVSTLDSIPQSANKSDKVDHTLGLGSRIAARFAALALTEELPDIERTELATIPAL